jgi:hypothetical protein
MSFKKFAFLLFFITLFGVVFYWSQWNHPSSEHLDQSSSVMNESGRSIEAPPESPFRKKSPPREIQSEEPELQQRKPVDSTRMAPGKPVFDVSQMTLQDEPLFARTGWKVLLGQRATKLNMKPEDSTWHVGNYALNEGISSVESSFEPTSPMVVYDARRKIPGVVTGTFVVTLRTASEPSALLKDQRVRVLNSFPEISTYFVTSSQTPFSLTNFKNLLVAKAIVASVEIEVLSRNYEKL